KTFAPELNALIIHLPVDGSRDLDPAVEQVGADRSDRPFALADIVRCRKEVREAARVDLLLALLPSLQQRLARGLEAPRQRGDEADCLRAQDAVAPRWGRLEKL